MFWLFPIVPRHGCSPPGQNRDNFSRVILWQAPWPNLPHSQFGLFLLLGLAAHGGRGDPQDGSRANSPRVDIQPPLVPRQGPVLRVLGIARISTKNQDERSLDDQIASYKSWLADRYVGNVSWTIIQSQGSGERLDRSETAEAEELIASGQIDLVITEDLARIFRRVNAYMFCEMCVDHETRLIALNDQVDTASDWQLHAWFASFKGEMHNADTSARIKRSLDNRFQNGGALTCLVYGYEKLPGAENDDQIRKLPEAQAIYDRMFTMADQGASFSEIADWLNQQRVPTGPTCRRTHWYGPMVGRLMHNPILKGVRERGRRVTRRHNQSGRRYTAKAPPGNLKARHCPHLAFVDPDRYDRIIRKLDARNAMYRRKEIAAARSSRSRKRTTWPGQALTCGICHRQLIHQGLARKRCLMCQGSTNYQCWNSLTLNTELAADKLAIAIMQAIQNLPDFDEGFAKLVKERACVTQLSLRQKIAALEAQRQQLTTSFERLMEFVERGGDQQIALARQHRLQVELSAAETELAQLQQQVHHPMELPSIETLKGTALAVFQKGAKTDPSLVRQVNQLAPAIRVCPVRCCTGGRVLLRAVFDLHLVPLFAHLQHIDGVTERLTIPMQVDLFDPPQPVQYRQQIVALKDQGTLTERQIASQLGITQPVVQQAMILDRKMKQLEISDPYLTLQAPPPNYGKLRRHRHPRYRLEPLKEDSNNPTA